MTDRDRLARVIAASGLSARQWARTVVLRNERTVRRWLAGDSPIPAEVLGYLRRAEMRCPYDGYLLILDSDRDRGFCSDACRVCHLDSLEV